MDSWHFQYNIDADVEHSIVYEKIYGVWQVDTARSYAEDFKEEAKEIIKKPWVKMIDLMNWKTASPEVIDVVGQHLRWCAEHNMVLSVNILNNTVTYGYLQRMFARGATKDISKTFRSRHEAVQFLKQQGYRVRS
ncbi:MAG: hypothetical protein KAU36_07050 [candidate division Zixibacteria bacterium]|nr:hypothetical protein [candidate division Zixibacteria bacterium]